MKATQRTVSSDRFIPLRCGTESSLIKSCDDESTKASSYSRYISPCKSHRLRFNRWLSKHTPSLSQFITESLSKKTCAKKSVVQGAEKIMDAPNAIDNFYFSPLDWSHQAKIGVALATEIFLLNPYNIHAINIERFTNSLVSSLKFTSEATLLIGEETGRIELYDLNQIVQVRQIKCHYDRIGCLETTKDNSNLVFSASKDNSIKIWDLRLKSAQVACLNDHKREVCGLSYKNHLLASGANDNKVCIWDIRSHKVQKHLNYHQGAVKAIQWCPWKNLCLATGGGYKDRKVYLWNGEKQEIENCFDMKGQITGLKWKQSSKELITSHTFKANKPSYTYIWDPITAEIKTKLKGHIGRVIGLAVNPKKDNKICTLGADESLRIWRLGSQASQSQAQVPRDSFKEDDVR